MVNEMTLHGQVVGLGVQHADGSKDFKWLDKPIHNRIVQSGIDYMLTLNGSNSNFYTGTYAGVTRNLFNPWRRALATESYSLPNGCLQFMSIGTDNTPTEFSDTALGSQVGGYSETPAYSTTPYNGVMVDERYTKVLHLRITLQSIAVENETVISEVGWHGKIYGQEEYPLFSRVVLSNPVTLSAGERLIVCYQINETIGCDEHEISSSILNGLLDSEGNQVRAFTRRYVNNAVINENIGKYVSKIANVSTATEHYISQYGYGQDDENPIVYSVTIGIDYVKFVMTTPFFTITSSNTSNPGTILFSTDSNITYPIPAPFMSFPSMATGSVGTFQVADHVAGTNYRDTIVTIPPDWPNQTDGYSDIYAICYNGMFIRFGHYDTTDPSNPVWVPKPWRKQFGQRYKFTFRYKLSTADTV